MKKKVSPPADDGYTTDREYKGGNTPFIIGQEHLKVCRNRFVQPGLG